MEQNLTQANAQDPIKQALVYVIMTFRNADGMPVLIHDSVGVQISDTAILTRVSMRKELSEANAKPIKITLTWYGLQNQPTMEFINKEAGAAFIKSPKVDNIEFTYAVIITTKGNSEKQFNHLSVYPKLNFSDAYFATGNEFGAVYYYDGSVPKSTNGQLIQLVEDTILFDSALIEGRYAPLFVGAPIILNVEGTPIQNQISALVYLFETWIDNTTQNWYAVLLGPDKDFITENM